MLLGIPSKILAGETFNNVSDNSLKAAHFLETKKSELDSQANNDSSPNPASFSQQSDRQLGQVTNVNQLRDVALTDWAYETLRSLVDRYGCISGFPNQTYRGSKPLSRYEFAAGLNSCLNQIERLIASSDSVSTEDTETIERLNQEFAAELATLGTRLDRIENRTAAIEDSSFSTTTKLYGEVVNYVLGTFGDAKPDGTDIDDEIVFNNRVNFYFDTSFTGENLLSILVEASNINSPTESGGTNSLALNLEAFNDTENSVEISDVVTTQVA